MKIVTIGLAIALISGCSTESQPQREVLEVNPPPRVTHPEVEPHTETAKGDSVTSRLIPSLIVFDQDANEFSIETREYVGTSAPIYPGILQTVTVINGERYAGLIPPTPNAGSPDSIRYWSPISSIRFTDGRWEAHRHGIWMLSAMKRRSSDYHAGDPIRVWVRKLYRDGESIPFYMIGTEATSVPID